MLQLSLLGTPEIRLGEQPLSLKTAKARALLFYLAVTGKPHSRAILTNLLWGEMSETKARRNLTTTLASLRKELPSFLDVQSDHIAFWPELPYQLDVAKFEAQLQKGQATQDMRLIRAAAALYRGNFLEGLVVKDGPIFEEWVYIERERLRERHLQALQLLVDDAIRHNDYASGLDYAQQLLALDPWRETAHRQLMILHAQNDRRDAALAQFESCRQILAEELGIDPAPDTLALHMRLLEADSTCPHNLPPSPNRFIGRLTERQQIAQQLDNPDCRLLTIVGPGGVGKTRLALEAGRRYTDSELELSTRGFIDGVYFVSLSGLSDAAAATAPQISADINPIITALAEAIGYAFSGANLPQSQLLSYLANRSMLLICDNFEELLQGTIGPPVLDLLVALLAKAANVKLLITSRARLKLQEEWVLTIDGLPYPTEEEVVTMTRDTPDDGHEILTELRSYAAVDLFMQRGEQVCMGLMFSEDEARQVVSICQLLEGLPLGLELAANWVNDLSCAEIVVEIKQGIDILSADLHNLPARHRSLRAVFEYSWQLLISQEQTTLCKLSVFRGGFTRDAAKAVAGASLPMLVRLVDQTLLRRTGEHTTVRRYDMHALIRQFSAEKLQIPESSWLESATTHSRYFADFAQHCYARYLAGEYPKVMPMMVMENDNLRAAWMWLVESIRQGYTLENVVETLTLFAPPLAWFYLRQVRYMEGIEALQAADSALASTLQTRASDKIQHETLRKKIEVARVQLHIRLAMLLYYIGDYGETQRLIEGALPLVRSEGLLQEEARALEELSKCTRRRGDYATTKELTERGRQLSRQIGDRLGEIQALVAAAVTAADEGEYALAEEAGKQTITYYRQLNDTTNLVKTQSNLANTYVRQQKYVEAKLLLEEAHELARTEDNLFSQVMTGTNLAAVHLGLGDDEQAERYNQEALACAHEIGNQRWVATNLNALSKIYFRKGDWQAAEQYAVDALTITRSISSEADILSDLSCLAHAWACQGQIGQALRVLLVVQRHPSTVQVDREQNELLLQELRMESSPALLIQIEAWCKAASLDDVFTLVFLESPTPGTLINHIH